MNQKRNNLALIGMPSAGKSVIGRRLASLINFGFCDIDEVLVAQYHKELQDLLDDYGDERFLEIEGKALLGINLKNTVISPGGSCIYHDQGMAYLKSAATVIFLDVPQDIILRRLENLDTRGVVHLESTTSDGLIDLYKSRLSLYRKYADIDLAVGEESPEETVQNLLEVLQSRNIVR